MPSAADATFDQAAALAELQAMRQEIAGAADAILHAAETILARLDPQSPDARDIRQACCVAILGCAFRDLVGQRISKLEGWIGGEDIAFDPLLNGPATQGLGLDQAAADALFADLPASAVG